MKDPIIMKLDRHPKMEMKIEHLDIIDVKRTCSEHLDIIGVKRTCSEHLDIIDVKRTCSEHRMKAKQGLFIHHSAS
ncbi:hypothetical protein HDV06_005473 [Boothiomyces sp. JEL0866]|nr:hypothetical protein HDV06_005473 [Boothiomyces sp. JEL0866]